MSYLMDPKKYTMAKGPSKEQGDVNSTDQRKKYTEGLDEDTRFWMEEDARTFLHQALSTPVMNVLCVPPRGLPVYDTSKNKGSLKCGIFGRLPAGGFDRYERAVPDYRQRGRKGITPGP